MYSISSKLNSPISTIGKAMADKITATRLGKNSRFRFCVNNSFEHAVCEILNTFVLLDKSLLPHLECKFIVIELPVTFLLFGCLYLGKCSVIYQAGFLHI